MSKKYTRYTWINSLVRKRVNQGNLPSISLNDIKAKYDDKINKPCKKNKKQKLPLDIIQISGRIKLSEITR